MVCHYSFELSVQPLVLDAHTIIDDRADLFSLLQHAVGDSVLSEAPHSMAGVEQVYDHVLLLTQIKIVRLLGCFTLFTLCIILLDNTRLLSCSAL